MLESTRKQAVREYPSRWEAEPFYLPTGDEICIFEGAHANRLPVLLKGPTGCGKTRFLEYMTWKLTGGLGYRPDKKSSHARRGSGQALASRLKGQ